MAKRVKMTAVGYRGKHGLLKAGINSEELEDVLRGTLRKGFSANQGKVGSLNKQLATELSEHVAEAQQDSMKRRKVSTGRLHRALLDEENRYGDRFGFGVGNLQFLDKSEAKYWRQIDQGYEGHVGRVLFGLWGSKVSGIVPFKGGYGPYDRAIGPFSTTGEGTGQRFRPYGPPGDPKQGLDARNRRRQAHKLGYMKIKNPIEAQNFFEEGWESFNPRLAADRILREMGLKD